MTEVFLLENEEELNPGNDGEKSRNNDLSEEEEPNTGDASEEEEPHAGDSSEEDEPNAGGSSEEEEPNAGDSNEEKEPNAGDSSEEGEPNAGDSSEEEEPNAGDSSEEKEPNAGDSSEEELNAGDSSEEEEPNEGDSSEEEEPNADDSSENEEPNVCDSSEEEEPNAGDSSEEEEPNAGAPGGGEEANAGKRELLNAGYPGGGEEPWLRKRGGFAIGREPRLRKRGGVAIGREPLGIRYPVIRRQTAKTGFILFLVQMVFGCLSAVACGFFYMVYLCACHDIMFWFTGKQDLEREITFSGGTGIYYHYYKKMVAAPSFHTGFYELTTDNRTVSDQTINAVKLLSLYPEIVTSFMYRFINGPAIGEPIFCYISVIIGLQALYVISLFVCSWMMSGSWIAGLLTVTWFAITGPDTIRMDNPLPSRENWALPCFSCQVSALTVFLSNKIGSATEMFCYVTMSMTTLSFLLVWELSHYVLFVQAICLYVLDTTEMVPERKMANIHKMYVSTLILAYIINFQDTMLLSSPVLAFEVGCVLSKPIGRKILSSVAKEWIYKPILVITIAGGFSYMVKKLVKVEGNVIWAFLDFKIGTTKTIGFTVNFLMCLDSLRRTDQNLIQRLTQVWVFPFYLLVLVVFLLSYLETLVCRIRTLASGLRREPGSKLGDQPAVIYHVLQTLSFGGLTLFFDGMKYFWTPYVCMFTAFGVCSPDLWMTVIKWFRLKSPRTLILSLTLSTAVPTIIGCSLWTEYYHRVMAEMANLQEVQDVDTLDLVRWIRSNAPHGAVFAGSPQLLGTIKLCTGFAVTSLPVYTDFNLMKRTEDSYQVYSLKPAGEVYKVLNAHNTNFVIIDQSICDDSSCCQGCRIKDLIDVSNGHEACGEGETFPATNKGRFCYEIEKSYSPYTYYFTRVFWNRSYRIYKLNRVISFQY